MAGVALVPRAVRPRRGRRAVRPRWLPSLNPQDGGCKSDVLLSVLRALSSANQAGASPLWR